MLATWTAGGRAAGVAAGALAAAEVSAAEAGGAANPKSRLDCAELNSPVPAEHALSPTHRLPTTNPDAKPRHPRNLGIVSPCLPLPRLSQRWLCAVPQPRWCFSGSFNASPQVLARRQESDGEKRRPHRKKKNSPTAFLIQLGQQDSRLNGTRTTVRLHQEQLVNGGSVYLDRPVSHCEKMTMTSSAMTIQP